MKDIIKFSIIALCLIIGGFGARGQYQDTSLTIDSRVEDLIFKMTLPEKISQLGNSSSSISRLSVSSYNYWNEGIHGVARSGLATSFPVSIALSSTWDPELIYRVATAISDEARVKNNTEGKGLTYWCPTINMARDPRWGRAEENYGEDVYLASQIAVNFIKGMQGDDPKYLKTIATAKHFACNNVETNRHSISSNVDERSLREYYLPTFKACVTEGNVYSIMSAYNALNGVPSPANRTLLTKILRNEWGFNGCVVSDCGAINDVWANHDYVSTAAEATAISIMNGTDLNCGSIYAGNAASAVSSGLLSIADIDTALKRIFKARFLLGEFDPASAVSYKSIPDSLLDCQAHRNLALQAAREAIVLLKNDNAMLPLDLGSIDTIAVIGPHAKAVQLGGYSGTPEVSVSPLQGIAQRFGGEVYDLIIEAEDFSSQDGIRTESCDEGGQDIGYIENGDYAVYNNIDFDTGKVKLDIRVASNSSGGNIEVVLDNSSGQSLGTFAVPETGGWQNWTTLAVDIPKTTGVHNVYLKFTGGSGYLFNINWFFFYNEGFRDPMIIKGPVLYAQGCDISGSLVQSEFDKAANYAERADVAIVLCGIDLSIADEGNDRSSLDLPGVQEQLVKAVYDVNPNTILVLVTGSALSVNWAQDSLPAILCAWYDGQAQGTAIAEVLFGDYNPGGKLSTTWYKSTTDLPAMSDYDIKNNRTYMYFEDTPLYPFGFGLSYTDFSYDNQTLSSTSLGTDESITISADITNTGDVTGDEVAQLYVHVNSSVKRPVKELKGFRRITLQPDSTKTITFELKHEDLQYYDEATRTFKVESGNVDIYIGSSSEDIRLDSQIVVTGSTISSTYRQDPYNPFEAEYFENKSGTVSIKSCLQNKLCANLSGNNSYVSYKNLDFNTEAKQFYANLSSISTSSHIDIIVDSLDGATIGSLSISPTTDNETFEIQSCLVDEITGVRDIFLVLKGEISSACKINWFSFQDTVITNIGQFKTPEKNTGYQCNLFPNPVSSQLTFTYNLPEISHVFFEIYSLEGVLLRSFQQQKQHEGTHQFIIDTNAEKLNSGIYSVRFKANSFNKTMLFSVMNN
ncbi:MAG: glycoside hydrolase family 3 C-terminal domain-containing protein [Bacteroidales bacterium]|nr:glycoside hydrolase family 3 C-terminal domain-containing protein [Bacteroidales bacterium]